MKMLHTLCGKFAALVLVTLLLSTPTIAAQEPAVDHKAITFWSDGARLQGDVFQPIGLKPEQKLPGILLIHGWGGHKGNLNRIYAPQFASLGFVVMTFDLRSWGESDGFFLASEALPVVNKTSEVTIKGEHIRAIINPEKMLADTRAALAWFVAEPNIQADNIGLWGTSFGGGLALVTAANDKRVKALITQMGTVNSKANFSMIPEKMVAALETKRARGESMPYPGGQAGSSGLKGFPDLIAMKKYDPAAQWAKLMIPTLVIDASQEELFDPKINGHALYESLQGRVVSRYLLVPGKHYDLYRDEGYAVAFKAAQDWFVEHLK